jgi:Ulp1 family protease
MRLASGNVHKIVVPICAKNHASFVVIFLLSGEIVHFDTLRRSDRDRAVLSILTKFMASFTTEDLKRNYLFQAHSDLTRAE